MPVQYVNIVDFGGDSPGIGCLIMLALGPIVGFIGAFIVPIWLTYEIFVKTGWRNTDPYVKLAWVGLMLVCAACVLVAILAMLAWYILPIIQGVIAHS